MTPSATKFITPLTLHALSGNSVYQQDLVPDTAMLHIDLARWADLIVMAPASADFISQLAVGSAASLLASMCLAAGVPVFIAPAMNRAMWSNQATQKKHYHFITATNKFTCPRKWRAGVWRSWSGADDGASYTC